MRTLVLAALATGALTAGPAAAQLLHAPPSGDNQRSTVIQQIGPVEVSVTYSSPDVHAPDGSDRRGKIWGDLVPWGFADLGFGTCGAICPWRAGANENTVLGVSEDVTIEGQPLPAGSYGLFMAPGQDGWTLILSKNSTSWGSFFYDPAEDALRVRVQARENAHREWLTYEFTDRESDRATLELQWETLAVPIRIAVPNADELWYRSFARELRSAPGFSWQGWLQASQYLVQKKVHLEEAERWARHAVAGQFVGQANYQTLANLADALAAGGKAGEALATRRQAWDHPTTSVFELHAEGRKLIAQGEKDLALEVFELNARRHPDAWPVHVGLARGHAAKGDAQRALEHAKKALAQAPDDVNRRSLGEMVEKLQKGDTAVN
jgi:hypothetical protein